MDPERKENESVDFENALVLTGYGRFHYNLVAACALSLLAAGFQYGLSAYLIPAAQCDLQLSSAEMGALNIAFLVGGTCSSFLWGFLADMLGRRRILIVTLACDGILTLLSSVSQSSTILLIFRFLNGFVVGGPGTLVFSYIGEFHSERARAKSVCYVGFFFTLSWVLLPAIAWVIIPLSIDLHWGNFTFNSWRLYVATFSMPALAAAAWLNTLPESPKFLLARGNNKRSLEILTEMFAKNTAQSPENYPVKVLKTEINVSDRIADEPNTSSKAVKLLREIIDQIKYLFKPPLLSNTFLVSFIMFANMFGLYGLGMWLPELFSRFDSHHKLYPDHTITVCELMEFEKLEFSLSNQTEPEQFTQTLDKFEYNTSSSIEMNTTDIIFTETLHSAISCNSKMANEVFINTVIIGACCLLGNIGSGFLASRVNRRVMPVGLMLIGGAAVTALPWVTSAISNLLLACLFQAAMATCNMVVSGVIVDIFPTKVSALAVCTAIFAGRIGAIISNFVIGLLLDVSCQIPIFLVAGIVIAGGLLAFLLPVNNVHRVQIKKNVTLITWEDKATHRDSLNVYY